MHNWLKYTVHRLLIDRLPLRCFLRLSLSCIVRHLLRWSLKMTPYHLTPCSNHSFRNPLIYMLVGLNRSKEDVLCQYPNRPGSASTCSLCLNITGEVSPSSVRPEEDALCLFSLLLGYWQSTSSWTLQLCPNIKDVEEDVFMSLPSLAGCAHALY